MLAAGILSPLAYFASYRATAADPSADAFWQHWLALPMWPAGPAWFLWQLFTLSTLAAALHAIAPQSLTGLSNLGGEFKDRPLAFFVGLTTLSMLAYAPLAIAFTPWDWTSWGPFSFQLCRPLHYLVYFFAGFCIGAYGLERGILRCDGALARGWLIWLLAAVASFAVWGGLTSLTLQGWDLSPFPYRLAAALAFPLACAAGALSMLAICLRVRMQKRSLDSLSNNAYRIYLLHYGLVVWLQYALLGVALNAVGKGMIVFAGALALSWAAGSGLAAINPRHLAPLGKRAIADQPQ